MNSQLLPARHMPLHVLGFIYPQLLHYAGVYPALAAFNRRGVRSSTKLFSVNYIDYRQSQMQEFAPNILVAGITDMSSNHDNTCAGILVEHILCVTDTRFIR